MTINRKKYENKNLRLVIFIPSLCGGGAERVTSNLANYFFNKKWSVTIVTLASIESDFYVLHSGVERISLNLENNSAGLLSAIINNSNRIFALRRVLKQLHPKVALAMGDSANITLALASIGCKDLLTVGSERTYPPCHYLGSAREFLRKYLYGLLSAMVTLTQESSDWVYNHTNAQKVFVIPNVAIFPLPNQDPLLDLSIIPKGCNILLAVGRFSKEKQFTLLISVFQQLADSFPNWVLVILGEGLERKLLLEQIKSFGLIDRVYLPGQAGNMKQWYESADLYVLTSSFEGFPNTLVEAMAHGTPAVSFDCDTGPRDIIRNEVDGMLIPLNNISALKEGLRRLMSDRLLRLRFAEQALGVRERFSTKRIMNIWDKLFKDVEL
jgi:glycosyltransferase involved in cell wall biosynthesis